MTDLVADKRDSKTTVSWFKMEDEGGKENKHGTKIRWLKFSQKAIYVLVLFILTLVLLMQIWNCLEHYYEEPTYVETRVAPQHQAMFPAMTICPQNNGYNEEKLKVNLRFFKPFQISLKLCTKILNIKLIIHNV